jgi:hypothetical protein
MQHMRGPSGYYISTTINDRDWAVGSRKGPHKPANLVDADRLVKALRARCHRHHQESRGETATIAADLGTLGTLGRVMNSQKLGRLADQLGALVETQTAKPQRRSRVPRTGCGRREAITQCDGLLTHARGDAHGEQRANRGHVTDADAAAGRRADARTAGTPTRLAHDRCRADRCDYAGYQSWWQHHRGGREPIGLAEQLAQVLRKPKYSVKWRRERDSNPRNPSGFNGFQDRRLKPLGHLSSVREIARIPLRLASRRRLSTGARSAKVDANGAEAPSSAIAGIASSSPAYFRAAITSRPSMNGRSAVGTTTDPSSCW